MNSLRCSLSQEQARHAQKTQNASRANALSNPCASSQPETPSSPSMPRPHPKTATIASNPMPGSTRSASIVENPASSSAREAGNPFRRKPPPKPPSTSGQPRPTGPKPLPNFPISNENATYSKSSRTIETLFRASSTPRPPRFFHSSTNGSRSGAECWTKRATFSIPISLFHSVRSPTQDAPYLSSYACASPHPTPSFMRSPLTTTPAMPSGPLTSASSRTNPQLPKWAIRF